MFLFGVDYYPEHWPEERWALDVKLMADAGFNVVRLAEFAWTKMEPSQGKFDFDWLDRVIAIFQGNGIQVILGTPTASPPAWLMQHNPDLFRVTENGQRITYGNRRVYCPNNPLFHRRSREIVFEMASHYHDHPAVIGWQIDNEFGDRCYCPVCLEAFRIWLKNRYGCLEDLNKRWGTIFWSHLYSSWDEIPLPLSSGNSPNPSLALDYYRFASDSYVDYQQMQVDLIRKICPGHVVTHNFMGFNYDNLNYFDLAATLDIVSHDNYPRTQWNMQPSVEPSWLGLGLDTMRGLKGKNIWVLEQQAGQGGWEILSVAPRPGELRLWAYQAIAHGADGIVFFRWRTSRYGTEQFWHGLLDHDGTPSRRYDEIKRMGREITTIGSSLLGSTVQAETALLLSYDSRFAFQIQAQNPLFNYKGHFFQLYQAFHRRNIPIDVIGPMGDFAAYKIIIAPSLHVLTEELATGLKLFVQNGGTLIVTQRSGVKDESNLVVERRLPGLLTEVCGVEIEEYDSLGPEMTNEIKFQAPDWHEPSHHEVGILCEVLKPVTADVVAWYTQDYYASRPAITLNHYGKGQAIYIGAVGLATLYRDIAAWVHDLAQIKCMVSSTADVEVTRRSHPDREFLFVLNHSDQTQSIDIDQGYTNILNGQQFPAGSHSLVPKELWILTHGK